MVREPAVAGKFYTANPKELLQELDQMVVRQEADRVFGIIAPHAGYVYSGKVAGSVYGAIKVPDAVIVLGPNHTGMGWPVALSPAGDWITPLGSVKINSRLTELIEEHVPLARQDESAHRYEHSLEVQLPFLQFCNPNVSIAALCISVPDFPSLSAIGEGIAKAISEYGEEVLMVASSDMTHYESAQAAKAKDDVALAQVSALNPEALVKVCREEGITMCGVYPTAVMLVAAKALGAKQATLVRYATSGDVSGDLNKVVAYAAVTVS